MRVKNNLKKYGLGLLLVVLLGSNLGFAQQEPALYTGDPDNLVVDDPSNGLNGNTNGLNLSPTEAKKMEQLFQRYQEEIINGWESKAIYTQAKLIKQKKDLEKNLEIFSSSDQKIQEYNNILRPLENKIRTLQEQLAFLDNQLALTQYKITNVGEQIIHKQEEIKRNMEDVQRATLEVKNQERILMDYIVLIYQYEQQYYDPESKSLNDLKLLLSDQTISQTISAGDYLQIVQKTGSNILEQLEKVQEQLTNKEIELEEKQSRLQVLKEELDKQQLTLQEEQGAKQQLLEVTRGDEQRYQELLLLTQQQKEQSAEDISLLKDNIGNIQKELDVLRKNVKNIDDPALQKKAEAASYLLGTTDPNEKINKFPWPVEPKGGLSAYFHDNGYVAVFGVDHGAIDIPTPQSTPIIAPADAYTYKAKDNGYGYSYIILAHRGGFLTLYGHVSQLLVKEGDVVHKGDIIGLTGGAPGTKGAGWRTTGAHLHMEIWKDGKKVDPLIYMDLSKLPANKVQANMLPTKLEDVHLED